MTSRTLPLIALRFAGLSLGAAVDHQTSNLSLFDVLDEIRTAQIPCTLQTLVASFILEKQEAVDFNGKLLIQLVPPQQPALALGSGEIRMTADQRKMKAVFRFGSFPIHHSGTHRLVMACRPSVDQPTHPNTQPLLEVSLSFDVLLLSQNPAPTLLSSFNPASPLAH